MTYDSYTSSFSELSSTEAVDGMLRKCSSFPVTGRVKATSSGAVESREIDSVRLTAEPGAVEFVHFNDASTLTNQRPNVLPPDIYPRATPENYHRGISPTLNPNPSLTINPNRHLTLITQ